MFDKKKKDSDSNAAKAGRDSNRSAGKRNTEETGKIGKLNTTSSKQNYQKKETGNFETNSLLQESLHRKISKKIEENQF